MEDRNAATLSILIGNVALQGELLGPDEPHGVVLFAHGSGSSRFSPRNQFVAAELRAAGLSTLLIDLLTRKEERIDGIAGHLRFDLPLLADRLIGLIDWLHRNPQTAGASIGIFGGSTGGGAALLAAAKRPDGVAAVVSRGGRPDLAVSALPFVRCPTLFIVGERDPEVIELNREAFTQLDCPKRFEVIPGASHLFEEPGTLEHVAELARDFFLLHLHGVRATQ